MLEDKKKIRETVVLRKAQYNEQSLLELSAKALSYLEETAIFQKAKTILIYHSLKDEVHTHTFIEKWKEEKEILLPIVVGSDLKLRKYVDRKNITKGSFGIEEPAGEDIFDYDKIDLVIIPGIAFDKQGNRLGRGKGFYDRLLPKIKGFKIGICFSFQIFSQIPTESFDHKMDTVLTEKGLINEI
jgi:5,10-methenyltetrahydrofolate synthetase